LYVREWPRAELIGSSRTFQRGNDSVCTDPSFTSVQSNPGSYNRKSFSAPPLSFSRTFSQSFRQEWVIPLTLASPRDASYERREIGSHIARSRARALGDNNVSHVAPFSRIAAPTITHTHTHTRTHILPRGLLPFSFDGLTRTYRYVSSDSAYGSTRRLVNSDLSAARCARE